MNIPAPTCLRKNWLLGEERLFGLELVRNVKRSSARYLTPFQHLLVRSDLKLNHYLDGLVFVVSQSPGTSRILALEVKIVALRDEAEIRLGLVLVDLLVEMRGGALWHAKFLCLFCGKGLLLTTEKLGGHASVDAKLGSEPRIAHVDAEGCLKVSTRGCF